MQEDTPSSLLLLRRRLKTRNKSLKFPSIASIPLLIILISSSPVISTTKSGTQISRAQLEDVGSTLAVAIVATTTSNTTTITPLSQVTSNIPDESGSIQRQTGSLAPPLGLGLNDQRPVEGGESVTANGTSSSRTIKRMTAPAGTGNAQDPEDSVVSLASLDHHYGFSLAKRKLLSKIEPSMLNSAVINGKVNLPCDISPPNADDSVALILWYKDDSLAPIYTIDARKVNSLDKAKTILDDAYANRANFNLRAKPAHLQLDQIRRLDEGDYRCRVDFKKGRTVNTIISLRVIVPPEDLSITTSDRRQRLEGLIGPFNEGSELSLVCLATGGKPRPQITWKRDFNVLDETNLHVDKEATSVVLKIPSLSKNHLLSIFTCQASNNNLTSPLQSSITLDLNLRPQEISLKQLRPQEPLVAGQTATFECLTHGSRPQASIHWWFQGSRHNPMVDADQQQTVSRLTVQLQRSFNQQPLTCVAENPRIAQSSIRQTIKLDVHYPPQLSIKLEPPSGSGSGSGIIGSSDAATVAASGGGQVAQATSSITDLVNAASIQEGNDIYLTCQLDANPKPVKPILWRFNGKAMQFNPGNSNPMIVMNNQSLVLRKVSRQQSGAYTCEASNQHGFNVSKPLELQVRHAPACSTDDILVFEASVGQTVALDCKVLANPSKSVHFSWFSAPNERNLVDWLQRDVSLDEQIDESTSRLKYRIRDERSFGLVKCKAKNGIGLQQRPCLFQIIQAPMPTMRHNCQLNDVSSNSLQLTCKPNEHLKSEDFEVTSKSSNDGLQGNELDDFRAHRQPSGLKSWLNLEAMKSSVQSGSLNSDPTQAIPNLRLVYPPNWLMGELYKHDDNQVATTGSENSSDTLIAYIIVGSANQLANVKSIVEENGLFSANPRSVYYVMTKQLNETGVNITNLAATTIEPQISRFFASNYPLLSHNQDQMMTPVNSSSAARSLVIEDPSIKLADSFAFTVPKLEPRSKYKLFIYGQNLANKTRDWLVVKGETLPEDPAQLSSSSASNMRSMSQRQPSLAASSRSLDSNGSFDGHQSDAEVNSASPTSNMSPGQQKSIVMRSGDQESNSDNLNSNDNTAFNGNSDAGQLDGLKGSQLNLGDSILLAGKFNQMSQLKDYAVYYAKQKPLLAIPAIVTLLLILAMLAVWTTGSLVQCVRGGSRRRNGRRGSSNDQSTSKKYLANGDDNQSHRKSSVSSGEPNGRLGGSNDQRNYVVGSPSNESYESNNSSHAEQSRGSNANLLHNNSLAQMTLHNGTQVIDSPMDGTGIYTIQTPDLNSSNNNMGNATTSTHNATTALMNPLTIGANQSELRYEAALDRIYQTNSCGPFLGSLDRRLTGCNSMNHQGDYPIYLTETSGNFVQVHDPTSGQLIQQQAQKFYLNGDSYENQASMRMGSIDRRLSGSHNGVNSHHLPNQMKPTSQQQQQIVLGQFEPTIYLPTSARQSQRVRDISSNQYFTNESFSSTECSSEVTHQSSASNNRTKQQRVAFDLSNHQVNGKPIAKPRSNLVTLSDSNNNANSSSGCNYHLDDSSQAAISASNKRGNKLDHSHQRHLIHGFDHNNLAPRSKTSGDSGASSSNNSGITADSGHESPPTAETNSTTTGGGMCQHNGRLATTSYFPSPSELTNVNRNGDSGMGTGNNLVVLMELSPGSQESGGTLMHSIDSYGEMNGPFVQLHNNHQMSTSFTSTSANQNEELLEVKDVDHWL